MYTHKRGLAGTCMHIMSTIDQATAQDDGRAGIAWKDT